MPKKKRTRQQKMQTDAKRQTSTRTHVASSAAVTREVKEQPKAPTSDNTFSLPQNYINKVVAATHVSPKTVAISTSEYTYLSRDLIKTLSLTSGIIALELVIYFFVMK